MIRNQWGVVAVCLFGFFKELRPSESFVTEFLLGPSKNLTEPQVFQEIYPVWTYSYLVLLVAVFLLTDFLRYKPVIILDGFAFIATTLLLLYGTSVAAMQVVEFLYAVATSTEVAYSTYIYTQRVSFDFAKLTSFSQAATLSGRCLAGIVAQTLISTGICDFHSLNYITLGAVCIATCFAISLPRVPRSIYFYREVAMLPEELVAEKQGSRFWYVWLLIYSDFKISYSKKYVIKWSIWWAFATCINLQVVNYIQPLWETIAPASSNKIYNGAVDATQNILSAAAALAIGYVNIDWAKWGEPVLAFVSVADGVILLVMSWHSSIWVSYGMFVLFMVTYQILITVASAEVAKNLAEHCYGLIFGINTFAALVLQTVLTTVVASNAGIALPPKEQFIVYGVYFLVLGGVFAFIAIYEACRRSISRTELEALSIPS